MAKKKSAADSDPRWTLSLKPAPGELKIVHALVITRDPTTGTDAIAEADQLTAWLTHWRLMAPPPLTSNDVERALTLRHVLISMIRSNVGANALASLNDLAGGAPLRLRFEAVGETRVEPFAEGFNGVLAHLLHTIAQALDNGRFTRLKICGNSKCQQIFYDHSPNRVGTWCSKPCANAIHGKAFRRRNPHYYSYKPRRGAFRSRES